MKNPNLHDKLSRRERQIMEIIYRGGRATAGDVLTELPDAPGYSTVRRLLGILEEKGHLRHEQDGPRYVYIPTVPRRQAGRSALAGLLRTFYGNSREKMVAALLDTQSAELTDEELDNLAGLIERARRKGR